MSAHINQRDALAQELVSQHPKACELIVNLIRVIGEEKRRYVAEGARETLTVNELAENLIDIADALSDSDISDVQHDHAIRVMSGFIADLESAGLQIP